MSLSQAHIIGDSPLPPPGTEIAGGANDLEWHNARVPSVLSDRSRRRFMLMREVLGRLLLSACGWCSWEPSSPPWWCTSVSSKLGIAAPLLPSPSHPTPTMLIFPPSLRPRSPAPADPGQVLGRRTFGDNDSRIARPESRWRGSFSLRIRAISGLY